MMVTSLEHGCGGEQGAGKRTPVLWTRPGGRAKCSREIGLGSSL